MMFLFQRKTKKMILQWESSGKPQASLAAPHHGMKTAMLTSPQWLKHRARLAAQKARQ
jgi:hypothetical protein